MDERCYICDRDSRHPLKAHSIWTAEPISEASKKMVTGDTLVTTT